MKKPSKVPRVIGPGGILPVLEIRQIALDATAEDLHIDAGAERFDDLVDSEQTDHHGDDPDPIPKRGDVVGKTLPAAQGVHAYGAENQPQSGHDQCLDHRAPDQVGDNDKRHHHQGEVLRRIEDQGGPGKGRGQEHEPEHPEGSCDEGPQGGDPQRRSRPTLLGHLVAVQAGNHGGRLAGDIDEDRGGRPAVHRPVGDPAHHDDPGDRVEMIGRRQKQRHGAGRPDSRQDPDQRPGQTAEEAIERYSRGCRAIIRPPSRFSIRLSCPYRGDTVRWF